MLPSLAAAAAACALVCVDLPMGASVEGSELFGGRGEGSNIRGRTLDIEVDEVPKEVAAGELADCLVEFAFALAVAAPSFSLADKVRLAEFVCSSEGITCCVFWAMVLKQSKGPANLEP